MLSFISAEELGLEWKDPILPILPCTSSAHRNAQARLSGGRRRVIARQLHDRFLFLYCDTVERGPQLPGFLQQRGGFYPEASGAALPELLGCVVQDFEGFRMHRPWALLALDTANWRRHRCLCHHGPQQRRRLLRHHACCQSQEGSSSSHAIRGGYSGDVVRRLVTASAVGEMNQVERVLPESSLLQLVHEQFLHRARSGRIFKRLLKRNPDLWPLV
mmetsp:Transcript_62302/g.100872  ORF Transcript_62302/g.100872 Transcript_62302/m.100872 type:complete len:217 (-) Transcript_62302:437-1087(-)